MEHPHFCFPIHLARIIPCGTRKFRNFERSSESCAMTREVTASLRSRRAPTRLSSSGRMSLLDRVHFCGLSMGGMIGLWLGVNAADRLNKLVLCNTAARIGTPESWNARIEAVRKNGMKSVAPAVVERWFSPAFRHKAPAAISNTQKVLENANPDGYAACCAAVRDFDFRVPLSRIRMPTLVIAGALDPATPPADGRFLAHHIPGARYAELNAAHLSNIEDQGPFNSEVAAFLNS